LEVPGKNIKIDGTVEIPELKVKKIVADELVQSSGGDETGGG